MYKLHSVERKDGMISF